MSGFMVSRDRQMADLRPWFPPAVGRHTCIYGKRLVSAVHKGYST